MYREAKLPTEMMEEERDGNFRNDDIYYVHEESVKQEAIFETSMNVRTSPLTL
jgi:hypothetical protein